MADRSPPLLERWCSRILKGIELKAELTELNKNRIRRQSGSRTSLSRSGLRLDLEIAIRRPGGLRTHATDQSAHLDCFGHDICFVRLTHLTNFLFRFSWSLRFIMLLPLI